MSAPNVIPNIDVGNEHRDRQRAIDAAIRQHGELVDSVKRIESEQLRQVEQLEIHNRSFAALNVRVDSEAVERKKSDVSNRWFSVFMAFLSFALGLVASYLPRIIAWVKSL